MKKRFLAIAIASGLASPLAANADATVFGKVHLSYGIVQSCDESTTPGSCTPGGSGSGEVDNWQVNSHNSRLGVKGEEDLGNGLSAVYHIEYAVNPDKNTNGNGLTRRNQFIGLKGGFGEIRVGRHDTPMKMSQGKFDLFNDTFADIAGPGALDISHADRRVDNVIAYLGKSSDIKYGVALIPGEGNGVSGGDGPADTISAAVIYDAGPVYAALAIDSNDDTAPGSYIDGTTRLTAMYTMGTMRFGAMFESESTTDGVQEQDMMAVNFSMGLGKDKVKFQYITSDDDVVEKTQTTLGYDWGLSKRTTVYAMYSDGTVDTSTGGTTVGEFTFAGVGMVQKF